MTETMHIRTGKPADAALLAATAERMFRDAFGASNDPAQMDAYCGSHYAESIHRAELEAPDMRVLFIEDDAAGVVAYAQLRLDSPESEIWRFYVDRSRHGRGVAQRLMEEALAHARAAGAIRIRLAVWEHNPRAQAFYAKCGFEVTGAQPFMLGTELQRDLVMTRAL